MTRRIVSIEQLKAVAADYAPPAPPHPAPPPPPARPIVPGNGRPNVAQRCAAYLRKVGPSIQGQHGSDRIFQAARIIWNDFGLDDHEGYSLLEEFNLKSQPQWPDEGKQGLRRKWEEAVKKGPGPEGRGYRARIDRAGYGGKSVVPHANGQPTPVPPGEPDSPHSANEGESAKPAFRFIDSEEFLAGDYRPQWLVPRILVRGQPGVIAGPSKGMKTSLLIDLAVSLATATAFLGQFPIRERVRVAVVSGESGQHTLKETCLRVLQAKGLDGDNLWGWLKWEFTLPTFSDLETMQAFGEALAEIEADVVVIDPTYLALGDIDAKNLFEMGRALKTIAAVLLKLRPGLTVILVHHANRLLPVGEVMELQHLAYSGLEQFARQFLLLNRREPYRNDGEHEIWVRVGGSTGHGGLWAVHVSEGLVEEDFSGRRWDVTVTPYDQAQNAVRTEAEARRRLSRVEQMQHDEDAVLQVIDAEVTRGQHGAHLRKIREATTFSHDRAQAAVQRLVDRNALEPAEWQRPAGKGATQTIRGWKRTAD